MKNYSILFLIFLFASCNWAKEKTIKTVNKTGELVAEGGSEFVEGFKKGIEKNIQQQIKIAESLTAKGVATSKVSYSETDSSTLISIYIIFNENFNGGISMNLFDQENLEYGRSIVKYKASKGDAKYIDFSFDKKTEIEKNGKIILDYIVE